MPEERVLRQRIADLESYGDRTASTPNDCDVSVLCQTSQKTSYPTVANSIYYCISVDLDGEDTEGASCTATPDGGEYFALNNGTQVPPEGTTIIVTVVGGKPCFRFDG